MNNNKNNSKEKLKKLNNKLNLFNSNNNRFSNNWLNSNSKCMLRDKLPNKECKKLKQRKECNLINLLKCNNKWSNKDKKWRLERELFKLNFNLPKIVQRV